MHHMFDIQIKFFGKEVLMGRAATGRTGIFLRLNAVNGVKSIRTLIAGHSP